MVTLCVPYAQARRTKRQRTSSGSSRGEGFAPGGSGLALARRDCDWLDELPDPAGLLLVTEALGEACIGQLRACCRRLDQWVAHELCKVRVS